MTEFTTLLAVDERHADELRVSLPTWERHKPEIFRPQNRILIFCDGTVDLAGWERELGWLLDRHGIEGKGGIVRLIPWAGNRGHSSQREKMLSAFVLGVSEVKTAWFLKLDTDTIATKPGEWMRAEWFGDGNVLAAPRWGYTKPADAVERLDRWANGVTGVSEFQPLHGNVNDPPSATTPIIRRPEMGAGLLRAPRVISYAYWGHTGWHKYVADLMQGQMPIASQDTLHWYLAERMRERYVRISRKERNAMGWKHCGRGGRKLREAAKEAMK